MPDDQPKLRTSASNRNPDDADFALFREALGDVARHIAEPRVAPPRPPADTTPTQRLADEQAVLDSLLDGFDEFGDIDGTESGDELLWRQPGLQTTVFKKLRRGAYVISRSLDLHGLVAAEARIAVVDFLQDALDDGVRCVKIIHGKGLGSKHRGPVLKNKIGLWLRKRDDVLAFTSAPNHDGGTGAVYVLLRKPKR